MNTWNRLKQHAFKAHKMWCLRTDVELPACPFSHLSPFQHQGIRRLNTFTHAMLPKQQQSSCNVLQASVQKESYSLDNLSYRRTIYARQNNATEVKPDALSVHTKRWRHTYLGVLVLKGFELCLGCFKCRLHCLHLLICCLVLLLHLHRQHIYPRAFFFCEALTLYNMPRPDEVDMCRLTDGCTPIVQ